MANGNQSTALVAVEQHDSGITPAAEYEISLQERKFELAQRKAKIYAQSDLVPREYKGNIGNVLIAENMAHRMGADTLMVMQNLYIVHGKPAWSAAFLIACFNSCGRFSAIKYHFSGEGDDYGCHAYCTETATGEHIEGPKVTLAMAKKEGWYGKNGSKWQTIPDLMFRYRAGTFLVRTTAPEIGMGLQTREEVEDLGPGNGISSAAAQGIAGLKNRMGIEEAPTVDEAIDAPFVDEVPIIEANETDTTDETNAAPETTELSLKDQVSQIVYQLQKDHGVKSKDIEKLLPDGVSKPSELTEEQAAEVLPTVQQLLESKQPG